LDYNKSIHTGDYSGEKRPDGRSRKGARFTMQTILSEYYGKVVNKKCQFIYSSLDGSAEVIAQAMIRVLEAYGFQVDVGKADPALGKYVAALDGYDLYVWGSGVVNGLPEPPLMEAIGFRGFGVPGPDDRVPEEKPRQWGRGVPLKKLVTFYTYDGARRGNNEIEGAKGYLDLETFDLDYHAIGEFACPAFKARPDRSFNMYQYVSEATGKDFRTAYTMLETYLKAPDCAYIQALPQETRDALETAKGLFQAEDERYAGCPVPWNNRTIDRPSERDIAKAETFMAEIIEDVFLPNVKENIQSKNVCIC